MPYDPFARGAYPVGVRTFALHHAALARSVALELWYPATTAYRGQDLDENNWDRYVPAPGVFGLAQPAVRDADAEGGVYPLIMYFHGAYGQRREASRICTHLASHGYIAASADFPGDSMSDLVPAEDGSAAKVAKTPVDESARNRPRQASLFIDLVLAMPLPSGVVIDPTRIGAGGISMGGFTSLAVNSVDGRLSAVFPMCPMFGERSMLPHVMRLQKLLRVDNWHRPVATLILTGDMDPFVNVEDIRQLYARMASPRRLVVVRNAGHMHWADNAEVGHEWFRKRYLSGEFPDPEVDGIALGTAMRPFAELISEEKANATARGLCLAHMDSHLKDSPEARAFIDGDLEGTLAARGIAVEVTADRRLLAPSS